MDKKEAQFLCVEAYNAYLSRMTLRVKDLVDKLRVYIDNHASQRNKSNPEMFRQVLNKLERNADATIHAMNKVKCFKDLFCVNSVIDDGDADLTCAIEIFEEIDYANLLSLEFMRKEDEFDEFYELYKDVRKDVYRLRRCYGCMQCFYQLNHYLHFPVDWNH